MAAPIATGEKSCVFGATITLSGAAADYCAAFSAAGLSDGATVCVTVILDAAHMAVYPAAVYHAGGTITLGSAAKTVGTLTAGDSVTVLASLSDPVSSAALGTAAYQADTAFAAASHTQAASTISDSTATGRAVLTGDAAAGRTALELGTAATQASTAFDAAGAAAAVTTTSIGAVPTGRTVSAGAGLTGGGDLTASRSLAVSFGTTSGTVAEGNDSRLTALGTASTKNVPSAATRATSAQVPLGDDPRLTTGAVNISISSGNSNIAAGTKLRQLELPFDCVFSSLVFRCDPANMPSAAHVQITVGSVNASTGAVTSILTGAYTQMNTGTNTATAALSGGSYAYTAGTRITFGVAQGSDGKGLYALLTVLATG